MRGRRRRYTFTSIASLVACAAVVLLCARSYTWSDRWIWTGDGGTHWIASADGGLYFRREFGAKPDDAPLAPQLLTRPLQAWDTLANDVATADSSAVFAGFGLFGRRRGAEGSDEVRVPYWFLALAAGSPVLWAVARRRRIDNRAAGNRCASCGYDLRATPGRCPECGTATTAKS